MKLTDDNIRNLLLRENYIEEESLKIADAYAVEKRLSLLESLQANGFITKDLLGQAVAESLKISYADLNSITPAKELLAQLPNEVALSKRVIPFSTEGSSVLITSDTPGQPQLKAELAQYFPGKTINLGYSLPQDIDQALVGYQEALNDRFAKIISEATQVAPTLVRELIVEAVTRQASDIHIEPQDDAVHIRFRIDGRLQPLATIANEYYGVILNRIKVLAKLRTDEHFSAQDGSIRMDLDKPIDLRVSILPTLRGEKVVIRLLNAYVRSLSLEELGLSELQMVKLREAAAKPFGMILVSGPTGSGKTTTLYGLMKLLNSVNINISTIEDPVEYRLAGVNHIQVSEDTNLTFSSGLRSIVRQDPDVILVGEIRDVETAEIAVNAALTGHLLLSTFHANDAATSIPRLVDMGVEPFLLSSTLELVIAQRLVRKLCEHCRYSVDVTAAQLKKDYPVASKYLPNISKLYQSKGCEICNGTGYSGRVAVYEFVNMTSKLREVILENPSSQQIQEIAQKEGSQTLFQNAMEKVASGVTSMEEVKRVVPNPNMYGKAKTKK